MLADRSYMQDDYQRERTAIHVWLVSVIAAAFILELVLLSPLLKSGSVIDAMVLTSASLRHGYAWTMVSHALVHDFDNPLPILFSVLSLYFLGKELTPLLGPRRFLVAFLSALILGAAAWGAVHWTDPKAIHYGATAGILGLLVVLSTVYPDQAISLLLSLRLRQLVWIIVAFDLLAFVLYEVRGARAPLQLAPSAHLGGMLAGWICGRFFLPRSGLDLAPAPFFRLPAWVRRKAVPPVAAPGPRVSLSQRSGLRSEVDRILDKINSQGFGSLTAEEKRVLDEAKDLLSRH